jgi:hypothetical protein
MSRPRLTWTVLIVLVWASMLSFGGVAAETVMLYPNIFADPPESLVRAREFMIAGSPGDYFPPLGASVVAFGLAAMVIVWRDRRLRWWIAAAAATFIACEFLFSAVFFWPRNEIMFVDPIGAHSPEHLRQIAAEFVAGHRVRLIGGGLTAALAFIALMRWTRIAPAARPDEGSQADLQTPQALR